MSNLTSSADVTQTKIVVKYWVENESLCELLQTSYRVAPIFIPNTQTYM